jgi:hypothetical protein
MLKLRTLVVPFTLFLFASLAHTQGASATSVHVDHGPGIGFSDCKAAPTVSAVGVASGNGLILSTGNAISARPVGTMGGFIGSFTMNGTPGSPFSAEVLEETDKFLADGNHIHRESQGRIFRDSQGRIRTENEFGNFSSAGDPQMFITISDPVEQRFIHLDPEHKTATITGFGTRSLNQGTVRPPQPTVDGAQPLRPATANTGVVLRAAGPTRTLSEEDLGTTQIEGFTANGKRHILTMAAGAMGNDKPIVTTSERWFSPDLKTDLVNSSENPESGKHVRRLLNIQIGDPDPMLFQVPADFTVKGNPQH